MLPIGSTGDDFMPYLKYFKTGPVGIRGCANRLEHHTPSRNQRAPIFEKLHQVDFPFTAKLVSTAAPNRICCSDGFGNIASPNLFRRFLMVSEWPCLSAVFKYRVLCKDNYEYW